MAGSGAELGEIAVCLLTGPQMHNALSLKPARHQRVTLGVHGRHLPTPPQRMGWREPIAKSLRPSEVVLLVEQPLKRPPKHLSEHDHPLVVEPYYEVRIGPYTSGQRLVVPVPIEEPAASAQDRLQSIEVLLPRGDLSDRFQLERVELRVPKAVCDGNPLCDPRLPEPGGPTTRTRCGASPCAMAKKVEPCPRRPVPRSARELRRLGCFLVGP